MSIIKNLYIFIITLLLSGITGYIYFNKIGLIIGIIFGIIIFFLFIEQLVGFLELEELKKKIKEIK